MTGRVLSFEGGSIEHFYHFLLGYLLPYARHAKSKTSHTLLLNCGPTMNPHLETVALALGNKWKYWDDWSPFIIRRTLPRWDFPRNHTSEFFAAISDLRALLEMATECPQQECPKSSNLVLVRSDLPEFYAQHGLAKRKGYGKSRREIANIVEITSCLSASKTTFSLYEPGIHSLKCQSKTFGHAKNVFGIRGAEWANLIWMRPGSRVYIVFNEGRMTPSIPALVKDLELHPQFEISSPTNPKVNPLAVRDFFRTISHPR